MLIARILNTFKARGAIRYSPELGFQVLERGEWKELKLELERVEAKGHAAISATHPSTLELTKEPYVSSRGDCIVGVEANKACTELSEKLKQHLLAGGRIKVVFQANGVKDELLAQGSPQLSLSSTTSIVIRKSKHVDERTLAIESNKAAAQLKRELIAKLKEGVKLVVQFYAISAPR